MSQVSIIIGREFNERVRKKSFIITTLLMPLLMIGLMFAPMLIMKYSRGDEKQIAVIDESGLVAPKLQSGEELVFQTTDLSTEAARKELTDKFGVLYIGSDILTNPNNVKLYVNSSSSLTVESNITGQLEEIIEAEKLKSYNIENLSQILQEVKTTVGMQTFRNDESQEEEWQAKSSVIATGVGFVLGMILYMFLLIYGSMVMQSVIEEKNSRVLEVMVSSVRPFDLMLGKILGVASVAVVQVLIWGVLCAVGAAAAVHMMPADVLAGVQAMQQGVPDAAASIDMNPEMLQVMAAVTDFGYILRIFAYLLLFNSFMSENNAASSNIGASVSAATGLEFLSNMVSNLLSNDDYNIVIRYRPKSELTSDEVDFGLSKSLINNRLFVEVEGNYLIDNKQAINSSMSNFMGEAYITYLIDRAGTLKAKAFTQTIDRFDENQGLQETGVGIYFKEDFDNFRDLRRRIRERFTNKKRKARREARREAARREKELRRAAADTLQAFRYVKHEKDAPAP